MYYIGLISGTSADAVDAAILRIGVRGAKLVHSIAYRYPPGLRRKILAVDAATTIAQQLRIDTELGQVFAAAALRLITESGISKDRIKAIGSHGQTIWHAPPNTMQVADPNRIAWITGITTISDFRRMDMAAGGQGAPLVPAFHDWQFKLRQSSSCVINIGGISNITIPGDTPAGYDTGPGNCLMDDWIKHCKGKSMDKSGVWASTGTVDTKLLQSILKDKYFSQKPPKSTGREYFNLAWIRRHIKKRQHRPQDVQATLAQLTANTIATAIKRHAGNCGRVLVCGGGWYNTNLMQKLRQKVQHDIQSTEIAGIPPQDVEAAAFAWLAWCRLHNRAGNVPTVTGAARPALLGAVYKPVP